MCVAEVALVGRATVNFVLVQGVLDLIWKDTSREAGDKFLNLVFIRGMENVVVNQNVVTKEGQLIHHEVNQYSVFGALRTCLVLHVLEEPANYGNRYHLG